MAQDGSKLLPIMLYDGDCGFCRHWVEKWRLITGKSLQYQPYQKVITGYPQVTENECRKAVRLIMPDGAVFSGAQAVFKAFALAGKCESLLWLYEHIPLFGPLSEFVYQSIARSRRLLSKLYGKNKCDL